MNYYREIPNNWEEIILENISLRIHYGFTASSIKKNTGTRLLRITDIQNYKVDWNSVPFCEIEPQDINKYILTEGDILFARTGATVGKSFLISGKIPEAVFASYLIRINLSTYVNAKYLYYFFQSADYWKQISNKSIGTGQPNVNGISLSNLNLLLAPANEQIRIVNRVEEIFSELESSEANLQKIQKKINIYKESILSNTLLNAKNSNVISLGEVINKRTSKVQPDKFSELKFIGLDSLQPNALAPNKIHEFKNFASAANYFESGDILYSRMRPYLNKVFKAEFKGAASGEFIVLSCKSIIINDYLKYLLHSKDFVDYANNRTTGDRPRVSFDEISAYKFNLCSIEEQINIVNEIESQFTTIEKAENGIKKIAESINNWRYSILKKAYSGQLDTANGDDEPAAELLKKIKVEKETYLAFRDTEKKILANKSKKVKMKKSIIDILKDAKQPLLAKEVWEESVYKNDIEAFYEALKKIQDEIIEPEKGFLSLKNENR